MTAPATNGATPPDATDIRPQVLIIMGVSGSGKTTIAQALDQHLGWPIQEGDDLHPAANRAKMSAGVPLTDEDRWPWLDRVAEWIDARLADRRGGLVTCSALKRIYRDRLIRGNPDVRLVFLHADRDVLADRLAKRRGHFMPASLLDSQLATLEPPTPDEHPLVVEVGAAPEQIAQAILAQLRVH